MKKQVQNIQEADSVLFLHLDGGVNVFTLRSSIKLLDYVLCTKNVICISQIKKKP